MVNLRAAGSLADDAGALWVLEAEDEAAVEEIVKADPFVAAEVIKSWKVVRLAYWFAQEANGSK
jgi:uncharacterized protein YciI